MYRLGLVLALAACYQPGSEAPCTVSCNAARECPDGLTCNANNRCALEDGSCQSFDAMPDGLVDHQDAPQDGPVVPDAPGPVGLCTPSTGSVTRAGISFGTWFTPDLDRPLFAIAVKFEGNQPVVNEGDVNGPTWTAMLPSEPNTTFFHPRLAPTNDEVFYLRDTNGAKAMQRAKRNTASNWSTITVLLKTENGTITLPINGNEEIGAPTTGTPRYMLVKDGPALDEYVEISATTWHRVRRHSTNFGMTNFLGHATLSEDGRRMVFSGQKSGENVSGFYTDRLAPGMPFTTAATKILGQANDSVEYPYLSNDCRHFYYTHPTSGQIIHVSYP